MEGTLVQSAAGPCEFSPSMHLVGLPLAGVGSTISPDKFTFTIEHVFFEVTVVGATVSPLVYALAVL